MTTQILHTFFVYGTLKDPNVQEWLFQTKLPMKKAILKNWAMYECKDGFYFIKPAKRSKVYGMLIDITDEQLQIADKWEELPVYKRERVNVFSVDDKHRKSVWVYTRRNIDGKRVNV